MSKKNRTRRKTVSCGGLPWKLVNGVLHVLLIKQFPDRDSWGIPKGHTNEGESMTECALREIREETGLDVQLHEKLPDVECSFRDEDKTVVSWVCTVIGNDVPSAIGPESEVADVRWFRIDELPTVHVYQRPLIAAAVNMLMKHMIGSNHC